MQVSGALFEPDLKSPEDVALAYAQRVFRKTGTHGELELEGVEHELRHWLYVGDPPAVELGAATPKWITVASVGGSGPGRSRDLPVYAYRSQASPLSSEGSNSIGTKIDLELAFEDGTQSKVVVALRPRELVHPERGPTFAIDPTWGVVMPLDK